MSHRLVAILAVFVCVSCGGVSINSRLAPATNLADRSNASKAKAVNSPDSRKNDGGEIAYTDMECPAVDIAGSNLVSHLGDSCNNKSPNKSTAVIADVRPDETATTAAAAELPSAPTGVVQRPNPPPPPPTPTPTPMPTSTQHGDVKSGVKDPLILVVSEPNECPELTEINTVPPSGSEQETECPTPQSEDMAQ